MKSGVVICVLIILSACKSDNRHIVDKNDLLQNPKMVITHYTGNAVAFISKGDRETMIFIPIEERDSDVFKRDSFDVFKAVNGRCSIKMMIVGLKERLLYCKNLKALDREICNIQDYTHYTKIWLSYKGYIEGPYRKLKEPLNDSCGLRVISDFGADSAKILEFNILNE